MKTLSRVARVLMVVVVVVGTGMTIKEGRTILEQNRKIAENDALIENMRAKKGRLEDDIKEVGEEMAEYPDSVRALKTGEVMSAAKSIAKQDLIYDNKIKRARNLNRSYREVRKGAVDRLVWWHIPLAFVFVLSFITHMVLRNRPQ